MYIEVILDWIYILYLKCTYFCLYFVQTNLKEFLGGSEVDLDFWSIFFPLSPCLLVCGDRFKLSPGSKGPKLGNFPKFWNPKKDSRIPFRKAEKSSPNFPNPKFDVSLACSRLDLESSFNSEKRDGTELRIGDRSGWRKEVCSTPACCTESNLGNMGSFITCIGITRSFLQVINFSSKFR